MKLSPTAWLIGVAIGCPPAVSGQRAVEPSPGEPVAVQNATPIASTRAADDVGQERTARRRPQFKRLVAGELEIVAMVCEVTAEQQTQLAKRLEAWIDPAVEAFVQQEQQPTEGRDPQRLPIADPAAVVAHAVQTACEELLGAEQAERYARELVFRRASRRQAAVQNMVASLDSYLLLTSAQRRALENRLLEAWPENWKPTLPEFVHAGPFVPAIPSRLVEPELSPQQRLVYRRLADTWPDAGWNGDDIDQNDARTLGEP